MCPHQIYEFRQLALPQVAKAMVPVFRSMLLIFIFMMIFGQLPAQSKGEDYAAVMNWVAPKSAISFSELKQTAGIWNLNDKPFTGWAVERYADGKLHRASEFRSGLQHGLTLLWYPDGSPQMSANYHQGALHGRFLGWYQGGGIIYDMVLNRGTYTADVLAESDDGRQSSDREDTEREGSDNDGSRE